MATKAIANVKEFYFSGIVDVTTAVKLLIQIDRTLSVLDALHILQA